MLDDVLPLMLLTVFLSILFATMELVRTDADGVETTLPVSVILDGFTLQTWIEQSLWNKTRLSLVHHLNEFCRKDLSCDAEYGTGNIHLINAVQYGPSSIRLNLTADKPILAANNTFGQVSSTYNYTALLAGAILRAKIEIEHSYDNQPLNPLFYSLTDSNPTLAIHRTSRLLFVLLGISLVALVFGATVFFFQRIRRHSYSKLLKTPRTLQQPTDDGIINNP